MKKLSIILAAILSLAFQSNAQNATSSASQTTKLSLSDAIDITFTGTSSATGAMVNFAFNNVNDFANGIQSSDYQIKVRSNKKFKVDVKTNASTFSYTGSTTPAPSMPVAQVLSLMMAANQTGGTLSSNFPSGQFGSLSSTSKTLLTSCNNGNNQWFNVKYKANPGFAYPAGEYTVDVVYTATQE